MTTILGVLIGVATGLISWWIVTRLLTPRVALSSQISKLSAEEFGPWRYRIKIANLHRRWTSHVVDVRITAKLRIRGLSRGDDWADYPIPVGHTGEMDYVESSTSPRLQIHRMNRTHLELLATHFEVDNPEDLSLERLVSHLPLEQLLSLGSQEEGSKPEIRVVLSAAHPYTGARRWFVGHYDSSAIVCGWFSEKHGRKGLEVERNDTLCQPTR